MYRNCILFLWLTSNPLKMDEGSIEIGKYDCCSLGMDINHGITEFPSLEKSFEIIESNLRPNTTLPTTPWHWVLCPILFSTSAGRVTPPPTWSAHSNGQSLCLWRIFFPDVQPGLLLVQLNIVSSCPVTGCLGSPWALHVMLPQVLKELTDVIARSFSVIFDPPWQQQEVLF